MPLATTFAALFGVFALLISGCDVTTRFRYQTGTKLYERASHQYYGRVVAYDSSHDFRNGMNAQPAVEIELAASDKSPNQQERVWASCDVISSGYETK